MRHFWSLITGIVIASLAWLLIAFAQGAMGKGESLNNFKGDYLVGGLVIVGVGLLLGLVSSLRTSPVGAIVAAVVFLGSTMFMLFARTDALKIFNYEIKVGNYTAGLADPLTTGVLGLVGGMLLIAVASPSRWRGTKTQTEVEQWTPPPPPSPWEPPTPTSVSSATESGDNKPF